VFVAFTALGAQRSGAYPKGGKSEPVLPPEGSRSGREREPNFRPNNVVMADYDCTIDCSLCTIYWLNLFLDRLTSRSRTSHYVVADVELLENLTNMNEVFRRLKTKSY
jgi:hypothetical protein